MRVGSREGGHESGDVETKGKTDDKKYIFGLFGRWRWRGGGGLCQYFLYFYYLYVHICVQIKKKSGQFLNFKKFLTRTPVSTLNGQIGSIFGVLLCT